MKPVALLLALFCSTLALQGQALIRPLVASEFGKQIIVQGTFVAKAKTYHAQNIVSEPYSLLVRAVGGRELDTPILIEYRLLADKSERKRIEREGSAHTFEAYESLYQPVLATPWVATGEQSMQFVLNHVLFLRIPTPKH